MSYFLCLAVPTDAANKPAFVFDPRIHHTDASDFPIGKLTQGKNRSGSAVLVQFGSSSATLIGKVGKQKTHNNDHTGLLMDGIRALLEQPNCSSVSLLAHWMKGYLATEEMVLRGERHLDLAGFAEALLVIEEDVRYVVRSSSQAPDVV